MDEKELPPWGGLTPWINLKILRNIELALHTECPDCHSTPIKISVWEVRSDGKMGRTYCIDCGRHGFFGRNLNDYNTNT